MSEHISDLGIVVPAHNAERCLHRSLGALAVQRGITLSVVVAVNGCRDATLEVAQRLAPELRDRDHRVVVIETPAGRAAAFNAAEELLPEAPRLFLDQDAVLSPDAGKMLADALRPDSGGEFAAPRLVLPRELSPLPAAYYDFWRGLPYVARSPVTIGAYGVSVAGRKRWDKFPSLHSDDKFVRLHFRAAERRIVEATYEVELPATVRGIVSARRRYLRGNRELAERYPELVAADVRRTDLRAALVVEPRRRLLAAPVFVGLYGYAYAAERLAGRRRH